MIYTIAVRTLKVALVLFLLLGWYVVSLCGKTTDVANKSRLTYAELLPINQWGFKSYHMIGCGSTVSVKTEVKTWLFVRITQEDSTFMSFGYSGIATGVESAVAP